MRGRHVGKAVGRIHRAEAKDQISPKEDQPRHQQSFEALSITHQLAFLWSSGVSTMSEHLGRKSNDFYRAAIHRSSAIEDL